MKKLFLTLACGIFMVSNAFSVNNNISNGGFELSPDLTGWSLSSTAPAEQVLGLETMHPISGTKSALLTITTAGVASGDLILSTNISCTKGASYKVSFKAKATNSNGTDISAIQMPIKVGTGTDVSPIVTFLDDHVIMSSTVQTYELTFTNTIVAGYCSLKFLTGNFPVGTSIWIDDVSIVETTNPLTNGNLCNGDFEAPASGKLCILPDYINFLDPNGWTQLKPDGAIFSAYASTTKPISGLKSYRANMTGTPGSTNAAYMLCWAFCPVVGETYTCNFKARVGGTVTLPFNGGIKMVSNDGSIVNFDNIDGVALDTMTQSFSFTSEPITAYAPYYSLCFQIGTLPTGGYIQLDDIVISQYDLNTGIKSISDRDDIKIFANNNQINVISPLNALATVYSITGQVIKKQLLNIGENKFEISKGIYVVQVRTSDQILKSTKVVVW